MQIPLCKKYFKQKIDYKNLVKAVEALGPTFIKFAQTLSTRSDIIGKNTAEALTQLCDRIPEFDSSIAVSIIEDELDDNLDNIFSSFDRKPVGAASVAQIHKAITIEDEIVAVKILRPNIIELFDRDIKLFRLIARIINNFSNRYDRLRLNEVIDLFEKTIKMETDLTSEASSASELKENLKSDNNIYIPRIDWSRTSRKILTMEWIDGVKIYDVDKIKSMGFESKIIAKNLVMSFFNQAYRDGFFHADLHSGNILIDRLGRIVLIDFGITGRLAKSDRIYIAEILYGFIKRDYMLVAKIHFKANYIPSDQSIELFASACRSIGEPIVGLPVNRISVAKLLRQLFKITEEFSMRTQPQLLLLQKTMVTIEGIGMMLNPDVNMWKLAEPWIINWAKKNIGFDAKIIDDLSDFTNKMVKFFDKENIIEKHYYHYNSNNMMMSIILAIIVLILFKLLISL